VSSQPADESAAIIALSLARTLLVSWSAGGYLVAADQHGNPTATHPL
jgi:hypothetical protein